MILLLISQEVKQSITMLFAACCSMIRYFYGSILYCVEFCIVCVVLYEYVVDNPGYQLIKVAGFFVACKLREVYSGWGN